ncbi:stability/partitioning determinant [Aliihoeflea sp. 40Bstr573]|uniref:stability/partitioning determinant n=1 Tax=Aliihoeflea sp. 40Bstr573 TaxID=2696467 RepID=UPI00209644D8|nr:stability/partitioning determinant [Aliihoeflea sp. 40Bstr573]MCO6388260.1 stability/partitioning determinant [Aliihoeflea sp. 40Bstr573]
MDKQRADLGFADALDEFDPAEWLPAAASANDKPAPVETSRAAEAAGFRSREPKAAPLVAKPPDPPRRRRTGRNAQFNLKARPETIEAYCAIADSQGWGLGETLEHAVALLEREYTQKS